MALLGPSSSAAVTLNLYPGFKDSARPVRAEFSRTFDGTLYRSSETRFRAWTLPLEFVPGSVADVVQSWWTSGTSLYFWEDPTTWPNSAWPVVIVNRDKPLDKWAHPYWTEYREGTITLEARSGY